MAGLAAALRRLDHGVTVLAPSTRASDLLEGRRVIHGHMPAGEVVAVGAALPISRRSQMGVPVGVRANLALALARLESDVVHGFEPGLPSLSYLALRDSGALSVPRGPGLGVELDRDALARLHEQYLACGLRNRDDTGYMQRVVPGYERVQPRW